MYFPCGSKDVCRVKQGSTNNYIEHPRIIEEMLKYIEPNYNRSVEALRSGEIDADSVATIAGFIVYVMSCSPGGMRLHSSTLRATVEVTAEMMDKHQMLPPSPEVLGGGSLSDLLHEGKVHIDIDGKFPQAMGISGFIERTISFANFDWDIL